MNRIGERIKKRRELLDMPLNKLAEKVGVSASALSQIEKSKSYPSILTIKHIAENLYTTVGELIGENEPIDNKPVQLKNEMEFVKRTSSGTEIFQLFPQDMNRHIDSQLLRFSRTSSLDKHFEKNLGQVFCYVLDGEILFELGESTYKLKSGDRIYINLKVDFEMTNIFDGITEVLWIQSPPNL